MSLGLTLDCLEGLCASFTVVRTLFPVSVPRGTTEVEGRLWRMWHICLVTGPTSSGLPVESSALDRP